MKISVKILVLNAIIAALYAALTITLAPISYGPLQVRVSEFMTLFAFYNPLYLPGLVLGCFLANLGSPFGVIDIVVGTFATFISLYAMRFCPNVFVASLMPVIFNAIIISLELAYLAEISFDVSILTTIFYIGLGEFVAVTILGILIMKILTKNELTKKYLEI